MRKSCNYEVLVVKKKNNLDPDPDSNLWLDLDPDSMNMDPDLMNITVLHMFLKAKMIPSCSLLSPFLGL